MTDTLKMVKEFHITYNHPVRSIPTVVHKDLNKLRYDLLAEELKELKEALDAEDVVETLDALLDLQYVLDGAFLALGFHRFKDAGMTEVHRSNMSKLDENGQPIYNENGKVLKGPNYSPPNLLKVLHLE